MAFAKNSKETESKEKPERPQSMADKFKALTALGKKLDTKYDSDNVLVKLGDKVGKKLPSISTGLPTFDWAVSGTGGIPRGRMIEIYGEPSAGKSSFTLHIVGECQKAGGIAAYIDMEHSLDPSWADTLGVDVDKLVISQPSSGNQALDIVNELVESRAVDIIVVDSVASLTPEAELSGDIGQAHVGQLSRMMSQALRILTAKCANNDVAIIWINQTRTNIGQLYGDPTTTTGGKALKFYSSIRLAVSRKEEIKQGSELRGHTIRIYAKKNKVFVPFQETTLQLNYSSGFDKESDLVEYADSLGVFEKKGSWFVIEGVNVANGLSAMKSLLKQNAEMFAKVKTEVEKRILEGPKGGV